MATDDDREGVALRDAIVGEPAPMLLATRGQPLSLHDLEEAARRRLPRPLFGYIAGACEDDWSLAENRAAIGRLALVPRVLRDTAGRSLATPLLGTRWAAPIGIAPTGLAAMMSYRGDLALARAAAAEGVPMIMSGASLLPLEEVAAAAPGSWFQAYLPSDVEWIDGMVDRVGRAGFGTLVITVDVPVGANRENLVRIGMSMPLRPTLRLAWDGVVRPRWLAGVFLRTLLRHGMPSFINARADGGEPVLSRTAERDFGMRDRFGWESLAQVRRRWPGRLVLKGVLHPDDARRAREEGVDAIIVSNHGGRQLDGVIAAIDALPGVVDAVGETPVMIDSGFRRGSDILKAIALGAKMVFIGRPMLYAAAWNGEAGVRHAIGLLKAELDRDLAMMGLLSPSALGGEHLRASGLG